MGGQLYSAAEKSVSGDTTAVAPVRRPARAASLRKNEALNYDYMLGHYGMREWSRPNGSGFLFEIHAAINLAQRDLAA